MFILGIDPGMMTGVVLLDTVSGSVEGWVDDSRKLKKDSVAFNVINTIEEATKPVNYNNNNVDVVSEDFVLRPGQAVNTVPLYILGAVAQWANFDDYLYMPAAHKRGNNAYNISKILKDNGLKSGEGKHLEDALSVSLHHWKIINAKEALTFLKGYRK